MNTKSQMACVWSGLIFGGLFCIGWGLIAHFLPPHSANASAQDIAQIYIDNTVPIRVGMMICMLATGFYAPWVVILYVVLKRIEGDKTPVMAMTQVVSGAVGYIVFCLPAMIWVTASFRPERDPQLLLLLNDLGWLILTVVISPFIMQCLAIGIGVLGDKQSQPLIPRWVGYFNVWAAVIFAPAALIPFFKMGPFAWTGFIGFWLPAGTFFATIIALTFYCKKAVYNREYISP